MALAEITNYKLWEDCDGDWNGAMENQNLGEITSLVNV